MKRLLLASAMVAVLAIPASAMDCAKTYRDFWDKFNLDGSAKSLSGDKLAVINRHALRAFDACSAGDETSASRFFAMIDLESPAKFSAEDLWKTLKEEGAAKTQ